MRKERELLDEDLGDQGASVGGNNCELLGGEVGVSSLQERNDGLEDNFLSKSVLMECWATSSQRRVSKHLVWAREQQREEIHLTT